MARQPSRAPRVAGEGQSGSLSRSFSARRITQVLAPTPTLLLTLLAALPAPVLAGVSAASLPTGVPGMSEPHTGSLLVDYFDAFLREQDIERFRLLVTTRYTEGTLCRLAESGNTQSRRAAVLALGLCGTFQSNAAVAHALRDSDLTVRRLAGDALWSIWFRADTPENNKVLEQVSHLIVRQQLDKAIELATTLNERAPRFAEAYNQRA